MELQQKKSEYFCSTDVPLVSVITPCYNGEKYLRDYFDSLLTQTYNNIEFFFINDGSSDNTEGIAVEYESKFTEKGIQYQHFFVTNRGQAAAINVALPLIQGKYLIWPDADDVLLKNNFSLKVDYLEKHNDIDLVITQTQCVDEALNPIKGQVICRKHKNMNSNVFLDYIDEKDVVFQPGVFMARVDALRRILPDMRIYEGKGGQNWQFILPLTYKKECGYIDQVTYLYRIHNQSHSHCTNSIDEMMNCINMHEDILTNVVLQICGKDNLESHLLIKRIKIKYLCERANVFLINHDIKAAFDIIMEFFKNNTLHFSQIIAVLKTFFMLILKQKLIKIIQFVKKNICFKWKKD